MRPLDRLSSIKVKLGVVIVATVVGTVLVLLVPGVNDLRTPRTQPARPELSPPR